MAKYRRPTIRPHRRTIKTKGGAPRIIKVKRGYRAGVLGGRKRKK